MPRPTMEDVARIAGVSAMTVSRFLNSPSLVAEGTRQRVQDAIEELGFVRNATASQLANGRSMAVGLVIPEMDNPFFTELAHSVEAALDDDGYLVILCNSDGSARREERHLRLLEEQRVAGVLLFPVSTEAPALLQRMHAEGAGTIFINHRSRRKDQCWVSVDHVVGGRLAAEHLIELGHRRIALINGRTSIDRPRDEPHQQSISAVVDRRRGFLARLADAKLTLIKAHDVETDAMTVAAGEQAAGRLLDRRNPPTAIFCGNDLLAGGALRAAAARGRSVPEDVAVLGYDDIELPAPWSVPLSSIRQPIGELGDHAARLLLEETKDAWKHEHRHVLLEPELVARESTATPPTTPRPDG